MECSRHELGIAGARHRGQKTRHTLRRVSFRGHDVRERSNAELRLPPEGRLQELGEVRILIDRSVPTNAAHCAQRRSDLRFVAQQTQDVCCVRIENVTKIEIAAQLSSARKLCSGRTKLGEDLFLDRIGDAGTHAQVRRFLVQTVEVGQVVGLNMLGILAASDLLSQLLYTGHASLNVRILYGGTLLIVRRRNHETYGRYDTFEVVRIKPCELCLSKRESLRIVCGELPVLDQRIQPAL